MDFYLTTSASTLPCFQITWCELFTFSPLQVVFTDGVTGGQSLSNAVQQLANKGVIVFVVGVGPNVDRGLLAQLTPRADLVYTATDFLDLYIKAGFLARQICQHARKYGYRKNDHHQMIAVMVKITMME